MKPRRWSFACGAGAADRGVTLLEVLVAAALLLLVLSLAVTVFKPALLTWIRGQQRSEAQRSVLVAGRWLRHDVEVCSADAIVIDSGAVMMVLCSPQGECDPTGETRWTEAVLYWVDSRGGLRRQAWTLAPETDPEAVTVPARDPEARVVARDIQLFDVRPEASGVAYRIEAVSGEDACRAVGLVRPLLGLTVQAPE